MAVRLPVSAGSFSAIALVGLTACEGAHSALAPAGRDAERIATLFWVMVVGAGVVWIVVMASAVYAVLRGQREHSERVAHRFIVGGGVLFPTVVLTALVFGGLAMLPPILDLGPDEPALEVSAEQFWWRATYRTEDGPVEVANELWLPTGRRTAIAIESPDVIHSFWVPSLAGKVDAIPGRRTHLAIEPTRVGMFRGACAEYCGLGHALMAMHVKTVDAETYAGWLARQAEPAAPPESERERRGRDAFLAHGCGACHTIRGTEAAGVIGPDLTHVGGRAHLAGVLPNDVASYRRFVAHPERVKPGATMPSFAVTLGDEELDAIAHYLDGLE